MKILFLTDDYPTSGGNSVTGVVRTLDRGLTQAGHDVLVMTTHRTIENSGIVRRDHVVSLPVSYRTSLRHYKNLYMPAVSRILDQEIARIQPDIIHAHNVHQYITYDGLRIAKKHTKKVFITLHDVMSFNFGRLATDRFLTTEGQDAHTSWIDHLKQAGLQWNPLRNFFIRKTLNANVKKVFAVSEALKLALEAHRIPRVSVLPNGTDATKWRTTPDVIEAFKERNSLHGKKVIFFGGRLSRDKGSAPLLAALRNIKETIPEVLLLVIGDVARLQGLIQEAGAEDLLGNVRSTGWLSQQEMAAAYGSADVVTTPSLCLDTFNLMNIEAMSAGKPVVGTIFGGTPEIVQDGITGYVRNPLKVESYAEALRSILADSSLATRMGEAGRKRVEEKYSLEKLVERQLEQYQV